MHKGLKSQLESLKRVLDADGYHVIAKVARPLSRPNKGGNLFPLAFTDLALVPVPRKKALIRGLIDELWPAQDHEGQVHLTVRGRKEWDEGPKHTLNHAEIELNHPTSNLYKLS